jgi:hypothetical protein
MISFTAALRAGLSGATVITALIKLAIALPDRIGRRPGLKVFVAGGVH